jgi:Pyruvate/2-oxoacid:ferredoxin oxidoreductase delta subunit
MSKKEQPSPFRPSEEQRRLMPEVSGNAVNGLGEERRRRPSPIYWHHPSTIAHGPLQRWMIEKSAREQPEIRDLHDKYGGRGPREPAPVAEAPTQDTPKNWSRRIKDFALAHEADLVGIARFDPAWVFEGYELDASWAIVLGIAMEQDALAKVWPEGGSVIEVMAKYNKGTRAAKALVDFLHRHGHAAEGHGGPIAGPLTMIPAALACGFGELGKHGSIINRQLGSSFRLAVVTTHLSLEADAPDSFGADDFCAACRVCEKACPPGAIAPAKQTVRGDSKWYVDFDLCNPYFNETWGCGICIAVCPWSLPGTAPGLAQRMSRRRARLQPPLEAK